LTGGGVRVAKNFSSADILEKRVRVYGFFDPSRTPEIAG